jgi:hypothetical protein
VQGALQTPLRRGFEPAMEGRSHTAALGLGQDACHIVEQSRSVLGLVC